MSLACGGSVVLASYVEIEKGAQEMLGGDINFIQFLTCAPFLSRMRDVFYGDLILGVLGRTWENNIRMSLYATGQEGMDRI